MQASLSWGGGGAVRRGWAWPLCAGLAAVVLLVLFARGVAAVAGNWSEPEYSHGWLIPAVSLVVLWQRRHRILAAAGAGSWAGTGLVLLGLLLLGLAWMALMQVPQAVALLIVMAGLGLAAIGPAGMRPAWLPLAFLLFALPVPNTA